MQPQQQQLHCRTTKRSRPWLGDSERFETSFPAPSTQESEDSKRLIAPPSNNLQLLQSQATKHLTGEQNLEPEFILMRKVSHAFNQEAAIIS